MVINILKNKYFSYNFINLIFLRIVSRILPIVMQGYLLRSTGVISFGGLGLAKSIGYCFTAIIGYGAYFTVPKYIALLNEDDDYKKNIGVLMSSRFIMQIFLSLICFFIYAYLVHIVPRVKDIGEFLFYFLFVAISSAMFPVGIFQGINKMFIVSILNPLTKIIIYICIPVFIKKSDDAIIYPMIFAIAEFIRLFLSFFILIFFLKIPIKKPSSKIIKQQIKDGWTTFCFDFYMLFYSHFPSIFLGILVNKESVTVYKIGDRLAQLVRDLLEPFLQCLYPIMNKLIKENFKEWIQLAKSVVIYNFFFMAILGFFCYYFSENIVNLFCGKCINVNITTDAVSVLKIHSFLPLLVTTSSILGLQILTPLKRGVFYSVILLFTGLIAIIMHFKLVPLYSSIGAAYAILFGELLTFIFLSLLVFYYKITLK